MKWIPQDTLDLSSLRYSRKPKSCCDFILFVYYLRGAKWSRLLWLPNVFFFNDTCRVPHALLQTSCSVIRAFCYACVLHRHSYLHSKADPTNSESSIWLSSYVTLIRLSIHTNEQNEQQKKWIDASVREQYTYLGQFDRCNRVGCIISVFGREELLWILGIWIQIPLDKKNCPLMNWDGKSWKIEIFGRAKVSFPLSQPCQNDILQIKFWIQWHRTN